MARLTDSPELQGKDLCLPRRKNDYETIGTSVETSVRGGAVGGCGSRCGILSISKPVSLGCHGQEPTEWV